MDFLKALGLSEQLSFGVSNLFQAHCPTISLDKTVIPKEALNSVALDGTVFSATNDMVLQGIKLKPHHARGASVISCDRVELNLKLTAHMSHPSAWSEQILADMLRPGGLLAVLVNCDKRILQNLMTCAVESANQATSSEDEMVAYATMLDHIGLGSKTEYLSARDKLLKLLWPNVLSRVMNNVCKSLYLNPVVLMQTLQLVQKNLMVEIGEFMVTIQLPMQDTPVTINATKLGFEYTSATSDASKRLLKMENFAVTFHGVEVLSVPKLSLAFEDTVKLTAEGKSTISLDQVTLGVMLRTFGVSSVSDVCGETIFEDLTVNYEFFKVLFRKFRTMRTGEQDSTFTRAEFDDIKVEFEESLTVLEVKPDKVSEHLSPNSFCHGKIHVPSRKAYINVTDGVIQKLGFILREMEGLIPSVEFQGASELIIQDYDRKELPDAVVKIVKPHLTLNMAHDRHDITIQGASLLLGELDAKEVKFSYHSLKNLVGFACDTFKYKLLGDGEGSSTPPYARLSFLYRVMHSLRGSPLTALVIPELPTTQISFSVNSLCTFDSPDTQYVLQGFAAKQLFTLPQSKRRRTFTAESLEIKPKSSPKNGSHKVTKLSLESNVSTTSLEGTLSLTADECALQLSFDDQGIGGAVRRFLMDAYASTVLPGECFPRYDVQITLNQLTVPLREDGFFKVDKLIADGMVHVHRTGLPIPTINTFSLFEEYRFEASLKCDVETAAIDIRAHRALSLIADPTAQINLQFSHGLYQTKFNRGKCIMALKVGQERDMEQALQYLSSLLSLDKAVTKNFPATRAPLGRCPPKLALYASQGVISTVYQGVSSLFWTKTAPQIQTAIPELLRAPSDFDTSKAFNPRFIDTPYLKEVLHPNFQTIFENVGFEVVVATSTHALHVNGSIQGSSTVTWEKDFPAFTSTVTISSITAHFNGDKDTKLITVDKILMDTSTPSVAPRAYNVTLKCSQMRVGLLTASRQVFSQWLTDVYQSTLGVQFPTWFHKFVIPQLPANPQIKFSFEPIEMIATWDTPYDVDLVGGDDSIGGITVTAMCNALGAISHEIKEQPQELLSLHMAMMNMPTHSFTTVSDLYFTDFILRLKDFVHKEVERHQKMWSIGKVLGSITGLVSFRLATPEQKESMLRHDQWRRILSDFEAWEKAPGSEKGKVYLHSSGVRLSRAPNNEIQINCVAESTKGLLKVRNQKEGGGIVVETIDGTKTPPPAPVPTTNPPPVQHVDPNGIPTPVPQPPTAVPLPQPPGPPATKGSPPPPPGPKGVPPGGKGVPPPPPGGKVPPPPGPGGVPPPPGPGGVPPPPGGVPPPPGMLGKGFGAPPPPPPPGKKMPVGPPPIPYTMVPKACRTHTLKTDKLTNIDKPPEFKTFFQPDNEDVGAEILGLRDYQDLIQKFAQIERAPTMRGTNNLTEDVSQMGFSAPKEQPRSKIHQKKNTQDSWELALKNIERTSKKTGSAKAVVGKSSDYRVLVENIIEGLEEMCFDNDEEVIVDELARAIQVTAKGGDDVPKLCAAFLKEPSTNISPVDTLTIHIYTKLKGGVNYITFWAKSQQFAETIETAKKDVKDIRSTCQVLNESQHFKKFLQLCLLSYNLLAQPHVAPSTARPFKPVYCLDVVEVLKCFYEQRDQWMMFWEFLNLKYPEVIQGLTHDLVGKITPVGRRVEDVEKDLVEVSVSVDRYIETVGKQIGATPARSKAAPWQSELQRTKGMLELASKESSELLKNLTGKQPDGTLTKEDDPNVTTIVDVMREVKKFVDFVQKVQGVTKK